MNTKTVTSNPAMERFEEIFRSFGEDARRKRAFDAFAEVGVPHRRVENWRWSDVRAGLKAIDGVEAGAKPSDPFSEIDAPVFRFTDEGFQEPDQRPAGVRFLAHTEAPAFSDAEELPMGALAAALADGPAALAIEIAAPLPYPIRLVFEGRQDRYHNVAVILREGAEATIIESCLSGGGFSNAILSYTLEEGARAERLIMQSGSHSAVQLHSAKVKLAENVAFSQTAFATGSKLCRLETRVIHERQNSKAVLNGAYLLADGFHCDMTSHVRHTDEHCTTDQLVKGAVQKGGKAAFQGKFFVKRGAQHTEAEMQHNALLLEDGAEVNAKPELEIYADDVACAHGNTCGALDADQLFYLRQRGIPETDARALLTESFVNEAFSEVSDDVVADIFQSAAHSWLTGDGA